LVLNRYLRELRICSGRFLDIQKYFYEVLGVWVFSSNTAYYFGEIESNSVLMISELTRTVKSMENKIIW